MGVIVRVLLRLLGQAVLGGNRLCVVRLPTVVGVEKFVPEAHQFHPGMGCHWRADPAPVIDSLSDLSRAITLSSGSPVAMSAEAGIFQPFFVSTAPFFCKSERFLRIVLSDTPHAWAADLIVKIGLLDIGLS